MNLNDALRIKPGDVISLVGGGGKTTLMFVLARELASSGKLVITTTTTKLSEPSPDETPFLIIQKDESEILSLISENLIRCKHVTVASERISLGKLKGIRPELIEKIALQNPNACIINEADGAAHRPLKAPNATEPVIPDNTTLVIPLIGADAFDCLLTEETVFRAEIASKLLGIPIGSVITNEAITFLLTSAKGIIKGSPSPARIVPFINKMDLANAMEKGRELATAILSCGNPRIEMVILGSLISSDPVKEVIK